MAQQTASTQKIKLSFTDAAKILTPYAKDKFLEQLKSVWLIITYLIAFQLLVLRLPLVDSLMISSGILVVIIGLMFFMEGLTLGLMPFGEVIGATLPRKAHLSIILAFAFILGMGATFAEPAIATLQLAGKSVNPLQAPLLYSLLNEFSLQLVVSVGIGVGIAVIFGVLRFLNNWSLKTLIYPLVILLAILTVIAHFNDILNPIIGLAWDCGAVTTGPVTVPLVLALGIGVCRIVGSGDSGSAGFGIVTLASLFPILVVLILGFAHFGLDDYYGRPNSNVEVSPSALSQLKEVKSIQQIQFQGFSDSEYNAFIENGTLPDEYQITYEGDKKLVEGQIVIENARILIQKKQATIDHFDNLRVWDPALNLVDKLKDATVGAVRAIIPLCIFLFLVLVFILREKVPFADEISLGIGFAVIGMLLFTLGIYLALDPLGSQVGSNVTSSFVPIQPFGLDGFHGPLYGATGGKIVAIVFSFILGYGATLAEPALNALGATVEKLTVGAFKKSLLMQAVALGVGVGIAAGIFKMIFDVPLTYLLIPPYLVLLFITFISSEDFVNFAWDSAGVTTGPITVPLVLAMGLGVGGAVGAVEGFGVLAMASVCPILSVLIVGLIVKRNQPAAIKEQQAAKEN